KQIKKKIIHKAKIKRNFYKTLEKEGTNLETPTFYREIFEGNNNSFDHDTKIEKNQKAKDMDDIPSPNYLKDKCEKEISLDLKRKDIKVLQERERIQREKLAEKEEIQLHRQKKKAYYVERNRMKKRLMKCNSKGQPYMKSRIDQILSKIKEKY
ncbi:13078_t:CDS:2, partial [Funneliformis mosseae]